MTRAGRIAAFLAWGAAIVTSCGCALALDQAAFFGAAALILLLSPGTLFLQLPLRRKLVFRLTAADTAEKGKAAKGGFTVENRSRFLFTGGVSAALALRNLLTGEETVNTVFTGAFPGKTEETGFDYTSPRCGAVLLRAENVRLYDWLGLFSVKAACDASARTAVLPDTFPVELIGDPAGGGAKSGDEVLSAPGADLTDLFGLRDYVPGDPLRAVHWKLSAKTDDLLIRVGSLPKENEILLLWDRSGDTADPAARDALAECIASIGQALLAGGVRCSLGRMEKNECYVQPAENDYAFLEALNVLLGAPDRTSPVSPRQLSESGRFSAALVFTAAKDASFLLADGKTAVLRCAPDGDITPDHYETQLQRLIL